MVSLDDYDSDDDDEFIPSTLCDDASVTSVDTLGRVFGMHVTDNPGCDCDVLLKKAWEQESWSGRKAKRRRLDAGGQKDIVAVEIGGDKWSKQLVSGEQWQHVVCGLTQKTLRGKLHKGDKVQSSTPPYPLPPLHPALANTYHKYHSSPTTVITTLATEIYH